MVTKLYLAKSDMNCLAFSDVFIHQQNETKKKAEVAAYFKRFEEAERLYLEMDRRYWSLCYDGLKLRSD